MERSDRATVLLIEGLEIKNYEPLKKQVVNMLNRWMDLKINEDNIPEAFFHTGPREGNYIRPIKIRVCDRNLKERILKRKGMLKPTQIYIKEHLTDKQDTIFYETRRAKKNKIIDDTWIRHGLVYVSFEKDKPGRIQRESTIVKNANDKYEYEHRDNTGQDPGEVEMDIPVQPTEGGHARPKTPAHATNAGQQRARPYSVTQGLEMPKINNKLQNMAQEDYPPLPKHGSEEEITGRVLRHNANGQKTDEPLSKTTNIGTTGSGAGNIQEVYPPPS